MDNSFWLYGVPKPFDATERLVVNPDGSIHLKDGQDKSIARIPMTTAFELSTESEGYGFGSSDGSGDGFGDVYYGVGYGDGSGDGFGDVYGDGYGDGSGGSRSK